MMTSSAFPVRLSIFDRIEHPNWLLKGIETLGVGFNARSWKIVKPNKGRSDELLPTNFALGKLALIIHFTVLLPFKILALIFKTIFRYIHTYKMASDTSYNLPKEALINHTPSSPLVPLKTVRSPPLSTDESRCRHANLDNLQPLLLSADGSFLDHKKSLFDTIPNPVKTFKATKTKSCPSLARITSAPAATIFCENKPSISSDTLASRIKDSGVSNMQILQTQLLTSQSNLHEKAEGLSFRGLTHSSTPLTFAGNDWTCPAAFALAQQFFNDKEKTVAGWKELRLFATAKEAFNYAAGTLYEASFLTPLREMCHSRLVQENLSNETDYLSLIDSLRDRISSQPQISTHDMDTARAIFTQPLLPFAEAYLGPSLKKLNGGALAKVFKADMKDVIRDNSQAHGIIYKTCLKTLSKFNRFDAHRNGNMPFQAVTLSQGNHCFTLLRHGVPTVEDGSIKIAPEYLAFLADLKRKGETVLYNCLLKPSGDELPRIRALFELAEKEEFKNTFYFVRFPLDGKLCDSYFLGDQVSLEQYIDELKVDVQNSIDAEGEARFDRNLSFIFSGPTRDIASNHLERTLQLTLKIINLAAGLKLGTQKRIFLLLFSHLLNAQLIRKLKPTFNNYTCKDGIDRGAVGLITLLLLQMSLSGMLDHSSETMLSTEKGFLSLLPKSGLPLESKVAKAPAASAHAPKDDFYEMNMYILRVLTHFPAYMAKSQNILDDRARWIEAFFEFVPALAARRQEANLELDKVNLNMSSPVEFDKRASACELAAMIDFMRNRKLSGGFTHFLYSQLCQQSHQQIDLEAIGKQRTRTDLFHQEFKLSYFENLRGFQRSPMPAEVTLILRQLTSSVAFAVPLNLITQAYHPLFVTATSLSSQPKIEFDQLTRIWTVTWADCSLPAFDDRNAGKQLGTINLNFEYQFSEEELHSAFLEASKIAALEKGNEVEKAKFAKLKAAARKRTGQPDDIPIAGKLTAILLPFERSLL